MNDDDAASQHWLFAYFTPETEADGEQVRFAVNAGPDAKSWTPLNGGNPVLVSDVGERGARDPFILRDHRRDRFVVLATDLRVAADGDWDRAEHRGSRSILVWESDDLITWSGPRLVPIAWENAGNAWAPKAFWSDERDAWLVFFASSLPNTAEVGGGYQRMFVAETTDFSSFTAPVLYLDLGRSVIDVTFLQVGEWRYRFSATSRPAESPEDEAHVFIERGRSLLDPNFEPWVIAVGKGDIRQGEGPAVVLPPDGSAPLLLIDEFGLSGYHLFEAADPDLRTWKHVHDAVLPPRARHGSLLAITAEEHRRLTARWC
ncbi:1,4-beta-xylanase [Arthrobacter sp. JZ12]|uniref:glycoside hydrolase family 43 protein n=1 Tax=Arthrobacter sp. JZ12 TaxID=2654190 RepID=UPI002B491D64|nr:glycoside hydrolase family 43 protein [Arthrobacter sp. JZ12]WRH25991.1 1,4-beta-xylanase [Arthrobacter sp. JZ12]